MVPLGGMQGLRVALAIAVLTLAVRTARAVDCPGSCDDHSPCTLDTCDSETGECRIVPLVGEEAVRCWTQPIVDAVDTTLTRLDATPRARLGGASAKAALHRHLVRVRALVSAVLGPFSPPTPGPPARSLAQVPREIRAACRHLERYRRRLVRAVADGLLDPVTAADLVPDAFDVCRPIILAP